MKNPTRRNRNIGTTKQGYSKDNKLVIPRPAVVMKNFYERLTNYNKDSKTINGNRFQFVIEETRNNSEHSCTVNDIAEILRHINPVDYSRLNLIVLRQPKRKEEILNSVWGRLIYLYEFEGEVQPAIILESQEIGKTIKWSTSLKPDFQKELDRLSKDGHKIERTKRKFLISSTTEAIRSTQLYRTIPHEIGHYKHFLEEVGEIEDSPDTETYEEYEIRDDKYHNLNFDIKEKYAHNYADEFLNEMKKVGVIPFDQIKDEKRNYA